MAYCMYLRKSRADVEAEARGEGETLARHERTLMDLAARMNIAIAPDAIYREIASGESIAARPEMQRLLADIERGRWQGVLVMEIERLARGKTREQGIVAEAFEYSGTKIVTPIKTYDPRDVYDNEYVEFSLFRSRQEYKSITRRLQDGRERSIRDGRFVTSIPPYGYDRKKLERQKGWTLVPNPDEAPVVRLIFEWYTGPERLTPVEIRNRLNAMKTPTRSGRPWNRVTIMAILTNNAYIGKVKWFERKTVRRMVSGEVRTNRQWSKTPLLVDGLHEPLIAVEVFELAQQIIKDRSTPPVPGPMTLQNPLAGILRCGLCGSAMRRQPRGTNLHRSGDRLYCGNPECPNGSTFLDLVEERMLKALEDWLRSYRLETNEPSPEMDRGTELAVLWQSLDRVNGEVTGLEKQIAALHDLLEQGVYSVTTFVERSKTLNARLYQAREEAMAVQAEVDKRAAPSPTREAIARRVQGIIEAYKASRDAETKNALLKEVLEKAVYTKPAGNGVRPDAFTLEIHPRLPRI